MIFLDSFFEPEVRDGFYVPSLMKRFWAAQLEVLQVVDRICQRHDIVYFAYAGTLLGAVRHGGFVPWDDDLDICMKREAFEQFLLIAETELPDGYRLFSYRTDDTDDLTVRVVNSDMIRMDEIFLERFHGFPYTAGLDIFPLDYVPAEPGAGRRMKDVLNALKTLADCNPSSKKKRDIYRIIRDYARNYHLEIDITRPWNNQICALMDQICAFYGKEETDEITSLIAWVNTDGRFRFPAASFDYAVRIQFENMTIPVPIAYNEMLPISYGKRFLLPYRGTSVHEYPLYASQEKLLIETYGVNPIDYQIPREELNREDSLSRSKPKKKAEAYIKTLTAAHEKIRRAMANGSDSVAAKILEICQDGAIKMGTMIEEAVDGESPAVQLLEEYCDQVYVFYEMLSKQQSVDGETICKNLNQIMERVKERAEAELEARRVSLFLPFKAEGWKYLEPFWRREHEDSDCDVYVVPVPYYIKKTNGEPGTQHYEGDRLPAHVPVNDYKLFDFERNRPDVVYFQHPYDTCDSAVSIHPSFTSKELRGYTEKLIYVPYFAVKEFGTDDKCAMANMKYYCVMPGLVYADQVIVQSENMRQRYLETLKQVTGEEAKTYWENKIVVSDAPVAYGYSATGKELRKVPEQWEFVLKRDGIRKKVVLYHVSISTLYTYTWQAVTKLREALCVFRKHSDRITLILCFNQTMDEMEHTLEMQILAEIRTMAEEYRKDHWGIWAEPTQLKYATEICDAFYGDEGNAAYQCIVAGKPVMIQNLGTCDMLEYRESRK